jgi:hypothetical protein
LYDFAPLICVGPLALKSPANITTSVSGAFPVFFSIYLRADLICMNRVSSVSTYKSLGGQYLSYKSLQLIMEIAGLSVSVEQVQHMFALDQDLRILDSLVREGIAHYTVRIGVKF